MQKLSKFAYWPLFILITATCFYLLFFLLTFFLKFAPEPIGSRADLFVEGAKITLSLTLTSGIIGLFFGIVLGLSKLNKFGPIRYLAESIIWIIRGTPLLVQILFAYYALPVLWPSLQMSEYIAAMFALSLNVGAYNAEVIRAGILAVPKGQTEASLSLGLSSFQNMKLIILPQAIKIITPPLVNNFVSLLKDSSLASSIGLLELTLAGNRISSETFLPVPIITTVAIIYLALTTAITFLTSVIEKKMFFRGSK